MADQTLQVQDLDVYYGPAHILQGVNLAVGSEPLALLGRNGMGKTTLCQAIMGLAPAAHGTVTFNGRDLTNRKPYQIAGAGLGYVPQGRRIFPSLTVHEHLKMLGKSKGPRGADSGALWTVDRIYDLFPRLAERRKSGAGSLSGGEQQMLAIGRALLTNPQLLIMDEPSEGLAPVIIDHLLGVLKRLSAEGLGILIVEQKLAVAAAIAERLVIMVSGRIAVEISAATLLEDADAQRRYLGVSPRSESRHEEG